MNIRGYEIGEWKNSNIGHTTVATKGGKKYFLKKYGEYKKPKRDSSSMSDSLYNRLLGEYNSFKANRIKINEKLREICASGGNILIPCDWFEDENCYIEVTEMVPNVINDEDVPRLSDAEKDLIMKTAAGALVNIHRHGIVHSDLKRSNILVARTSSGNAVAKIIDFDRSYFLSDIRPDELGGDQSYLSPELALCFTTDMADSSLENLSPKSDIFSLGVVFHDYFANGAHPSCENLPDSLKRRAASGGEVYVGETLLCGGKLVVSNVIKEKYLRHLIAAMIQLQPEDRPTAQEVLNVLKNKTVLPLKAGCVSIQGESDAEAAIGDNMFCEPWPEHGIRFDEDKLKASGYTAVVRKTSGDAHVYELHRDGKTRAYSFNNMIALGFAVATGAPKSTSSSSSSSSSSSTPTPAPTASGFSVCEVWPKDGDYKFDTDALKRSDYVKVERKKKLTMEGYELTRKDGSTKFQTGANLIRLDYLVKK